MDVKMNGMNHRFHVDRRNIGTVQLSFLFEFHYHMSLLTSPFDDVRLDGPQVTWNEQRMSLRHLHIVFCQSILVNPE